MSKKYFVRYPGQDKELEVNQAVYCAAEAAAGFHPKPGCGPEATDNFGGKGISGYVVYDFEVEVAEIRYWAITRKQFMDDCPHPGVAKGTACPLCGNLAHH